MPSAARPPPPVQVPAGGGLVRVLWLDDAGQAGETVQRLVV